MPKLLSKHHHGFRKASLQFVRVPPVPGALRVPGLQSSSSSVIPDTCHSCVGSQIHPHSKGGFCMG